MIEKVIDFKGDAIKKLDEEYKSGKYDRYGEAVCPAVAEALVRENLPECCKVKVEDMSQLHNVMTS